MVIFMICLGTGLYSAVTPGFLASSMLIAPNHTGFLIAWMNFVSCFARILLPYMVGVVVVQSTVEEWRLIFALGSISQILSGLIFLIFGKSKEQNWAKTKTTTPPTTNMNMK
uniref:Uncharacterized protein n=1 Tax=Romanomermis culicivorax TaxID=13658 RepID=A0A915I857_ROMCU